MSSPQPGYPQPGYPQPGYPQPGYSQPGYPQPGYPQPGYPQPQVGPPQPDAVPMYPQPPQLANPSPVIQQPPPQQQPPPGGDWMAVPSGGGPACPPGLEYLASLDQLLVKQQVEILEMITDFETSNKYKILNALGQQVFNAAESSNFCARCLCGPRRSFAMKIYDNAHNEVIHVKRPLKCDTCWIPCSKQTVEVYAPRGTLIGSIVKQWSLCSPKFDVKDAGGETVLKICGPFFTCAMCATAEFEVLSKDESIQVGKISKNWTGAAKEIFTDADNFGISFPLDLDVKMKAVLLGAVFLIDYLYYEKK